MSHAAEPINQRFERNVYPEPMTGCFLWGGYLNRAGYGTFYHSGESKVLAHRFAYEAAKGPIPEGLHLDHTCSVRCCVNPDHLEPVSLAENNRRTWQRGRQTAGQFQAAKTHCPKGHEYDAANTYIDPKGPRVCRECTRVAARRWKQETGYGRAV